MLELRTPVFHLPPITTMWNKDGASVRGLLLDIHGVLFNCSADGGYAIPGSVEAIQKLGPPHYLLIYGLTAKLNNNY